MKEVRPEWVDSPLSACQEIKEMCAVGVAGDESGAESSARKNLAQNFETKVVVSDRMSKKSNQSMDGDGIVSGGVEEDTFSDVRELSEEVLKGVVIKNKYFERERGKYYALASLDKWAMSKDLKHEMNLLDERMKLLVLRKAPGIHHTLKSIYEKREIINRRYKFLRGMGLPQAVTLKGIEGTRLSQDAFPVVAFQWEKKDPFSELAPFITQLLSQNGFKVVTDKSVPSVTYYLKGRLLVEEQFIKVEGFKKYYFQLELFFENRRGEKINSVEFKDYASGRTFDQAYSLAQLNIRKFLEEKIPELEWE